jgi:hypothetical protein
VLQILVTWLLCGFLALFLGSLATEVFHSEKGEKLASPLWLRFWTGLLVLYLFLSLLCFFVPLNSITKGLCWLFFFLLAFLRKDLIISMLSTIKRRIVLFHPAAAGLFILVTGVGFLKALGPPEIFDEGAYHLPLIRMWENKGLVVGMANLNAHYGLHSSWHLLSAFSNLSFIPGFQTEMALNGMLAAMLGLFAASRLNQALHQKAGDVPISSLIAVFLPFFLFRNLLSSPSTDIPAILGCWFFLLLWLESIENGLDSGRNTALFVFLPVFLLTVKASSGGILLVPFVFFLIAFQRMGFRQSLLPAFGLLLAIGIWFSQNFLISGYAVFPLPSTALGHPEWQVPLLSIQQKFYHEQFGAFAPPESYNLFWLKGWFAAHNPDSKVIILLAALFFCLAPYLAKKNILKRLEISGYFLLLLVLALVWFFTITEPRYGFGPLVISALMLPAVLLRAFIRKWQAFRYSLLVILLLMTSNVVKTMQEIHFSSFSLIKTEQAPAVLFRQVHCGNFLASCPEKYISRVPAGKPPFCWDCPFPCIPLEGIQDSSFVFQQKFAWFTTFVHNRKSSTL